MRSTNPLPAFKVLALVLLFCVCGPVTASAQEAADGQAARQQPQRPAPVAAGERRPAPAARASETACGGFLEQRSSSGQFQIVGGEREAERRLYSQGDMVYVDAGAQQGVRVGQEFSVVRPRGQFRSKFSRKNGSLGVYTQEVGVVRVVRVRDRVSVAEVTRSCSDLLVGDLLRPSERREAPPARAEAKLDIFAEPTGKQTGRIVLARDGREALSRDQIVFVDLGAEDNLRVGDYLTVFRPEGHGTFVNYGDEITANTRTDYQSNELSGGDFSNQAQRVKDVDGGKGGPTVKTPEIKRRRPPVPRKVVGELVVLRVEGRTATAVVTRVAQEIFTGDAVEVQ